MTCYAEVCLKEFCIDTSLNILLRLEPAQGFGVAAIDSNHGNQILFRDRQDGSRIGVIINTDDMFLVTDKLLSSFCDVGMLLMLKEQHIRFVVELTAKKNATSLAFSERMVEGVKCKVFRLKSMTFK